VDDLPVSQLLKRKAPASSDSEDDNVPLASILVSDKEVSVLPNQCAIEPVRRS
jgi:hypothetical protein